MSLVDGLTPLSCQDFRRPDSTVSLRGDVVSLGVMLRVMFREHNCGLEESSATVCHELPSQRASPACLLGASSSFVVIVDADYHLLKVRSLLRLCFSYRSVLGSCILMNGTVRANHEAPVLMSSSFLSGWLALGVVF